MRGTPSSLLVVLAMLVAILPVRSEEPSAKPDTPDPQEFVRQANDLWHLKKDYNGALAAFNRAVDAAPNDGSIRIKRAMFFEVISELVKEEDREKFKELARQDYQRVAEDETDSTRAGVARDGLTRLAGKTLLTPAPVKCPSEAVEAHERAESLYGARRLAEAVSEYEKTTAACPAAAAYWVDYADAYYGMEQYEKAKEVFGKAIEADPWSRSGHRFLADTEARLKDLDAAVHEAALAVVSDPVYEAAWGALRNYANVAGRGWARVYSRKTDVALGLDKNGKQSVTITLNQEGLSSAKKGDVGESDSKAKPTKSGHTPDELGWLAYGMSKAVIFEGKVIESGPTGTPVERKVDPTTMTALEIERIAVRSALDIGKGASGEPGPFWAMMMRADKAGFLDEAIFLHMLDAPLAKEYPAFREKNAAKLVEYLETVIVPRN